jgi:hypothetical protein
MSDEFRPRRRREYDEDAPRRSRSWRDDFDFGRDKEEMSAKPPAAGPSLLPWVLAGGGLVFGVIMVVIALVVVMRRHPAPATPEQPAQAAPQPGPPPAGRRIVTVADYQGCQIGEVVTLAGEGSLNTVRKPVVSVWLDKVDGFVVVADCTDPIRWFGPEAALDGRTVIVTGAIVDKGLAERRIGVLVLKDCTLRVP